MTAARLLLATGLLGACGGKPAGVDGGGDYCTVWGRALGGCATGSLPDGGALTFSVAQCEVSLAGSGCTDIDRQALGDGDYLNCLNVLPVCTQAQEQNFIETAATCFDGTGGTLAVHGGQIGGISPTCQAPAP